MARVLILALDPVFAAVVEDRLHVSGHESRTVSDPERALSEATDGRADLLVMRMELEGASGIDVVRRLRRRHETQTLPIVVLSENHESADRIEAYRAGVDDYLGEPCDPEELMLRLDRLLGSHRMLGLPVLQGDLTSQPIWEVVQYIQQASQSGELVIHGQRGSGRVHLARGCVLSARWKSLEGSDAMLAILDMKEGSFRLTTDPEGTQVPTDAPRIHDFLIEAAWIGDHLEKRRHHLPATGLPLELTADALPPAEEGLPTLPLDKVFDRIRRQRGVRLYELMNEEGEAPSKVRLAVAWLAEKGVVAPMEDASGERPPTTMEISSTMKLDLTVHRLLLAARDAGFDVSALPYLLLAEPGAWPELRQLFASVPGYLRITALHELVERMGRERGGTATLAAEVGKLQLHVQPLAGARQQVEAIAPACVLVWLDGAEDLELLRGVVDRLEAASACAVGVLVATEPAAASAASELTARTRKWQISTHAPQSLLGVLRLLHPPKA